MRYFWLVIILETLSFKNGLSQLCSGGLMATHWDQNEPFNNLAPSWYYENGSEKKAVAGCTAIALAQIMYYYQFPDEPKDGTIMYNIYDGKARDVEGNLWQNRSLDFTPVEYTWLCETTPQEEIEKVIYHAGIAIRSNYGADGTSGRRNNAIKHVLMERFHFGKIENIVRCDDCEIGVDCEIGECYSKQLFLNKIKNEIDNNRVVYLYARSQGGSSHSMVIDGYIGDELHINIGWGCEENRETDNYYDLDEIRPSLYGSNRSDNYNLFQEALINIFPDVENWTTYCQEAVPISNLNSNYTYSRSILPCPTLLFPEPNSHGNNNLLDFSWEAIQGAVDYSLSIKVLSTGEMILDSVNTYAGAPYFFSNVLLPFADSIEVTICPINYLGETENCTPYIYYTDTTNCGLSFFELNPVCINDTFYEIEVNISGLPNHFYDLWAEDTTGVLVSIDNVPQGVYVLGPIPTSKSVAVVVEDEAEPYDCHDAEFVIAPQCVSCSEISLELNTVYCDSNSYNVTIQVITDSSTIIDLYTGTPGINTHNNVSSGTYTFYNLTAGDDVLVIAEDTFKPYDCYRLLYVESPICNGSNSTSIIYRLEYFIDEDPGFGVADSIPIPESYNLLVNHAVSMTGISPGVHVIYIRAQDENGKWGFTHRKLFYVRPETEGQNRLLTNLEYFIDTDPGLGLGIPLTLENNTNSIDSYLLPLDTINPGVHVLYVRGKDNTGKWSFTQRKLFYIKPGDASSNRLLTNLEYFIDTDTGFGMGTPLTLENDTNSIDSYLIPLDTINPGIHVLYFRGKDNAGNWSFTQRKLFYIRPGSGPSNRLLTNLEYFIDTDPGFGLGNPLALENDTNSIDSYLLPLDTINPGVHVLYVRGKDNAGKWSFTSRKLFYIKPGSESPNRLLTDLEYFIDSDPGFGLGIPLALDNDTNSIALYAIALENFTPGLHHLYVRGKDNQGDWGYTIVKPFTIYVLGPIVYVDWDATGANIGTSWTNAYTRLEPALLLATLYDTIQEIWIAQGLYKPTSTTDRNISFTWADSTKLYGGFTGTETTRNQRTSDPTLVVLSGDIGISNDSTDNTYHVVFIDSTCQGCYLDRLTIKLGNSGGSTNSIDKGGGIHSLGNVEIKDVVVEYNSAASTGAAIYNIGPSADLRMMNCIFRFNNSPNGHDVHNANGANILIEGDVQIQD